jgi:hypothetical protein
MLLVAVKYFSLPLKLRDPEAEGLAGDVKVIVVLLDASAGPPVDAMKS